MNIYQQDNKILADEKATEMIARSHDPYNSEPPKTKLSENYLTPNEIFYVRNHGEIPVIDENEYKFVVNGLVKQPLELTIRDLQSDKFSTTTVISSLQCAGNRRTELVKVAPLKGEITWSEQAISNAQWEGVPLYQILQLAGVLPEAKHVEFIGLDHVKKGKGEPFGFGGSIELHKALSPEVILATKMNGKPLPRSHGFPLRMVVPGYIAARSVKWLASITLRKDPSPNHFQSIAYRMLPPFLPPTPPTGPMLGELSVSSAILSPEEGFHGLVKTPITVKGWASAGGLRSVVRVDLSVDGGHSWIPTKLTTSDSIASSSGPNVHIAGAWVLWEATVDFSQIGPVQLVCRAYDSAYNTQPEDSRPLWNWKGYMNNAIHRINILIAPKSYL